MNVLNHQFSYFIHEVARVWRETNGLTLRHIQNILVWISVIGFIPSIIVPLLATGILRWVTVGLLALFTLVLLNSLFRASYVVWQRDTTKLDLIKYQKDNIPNYMHPNFFKLFVDIATNEIRVEIEWFNGTIFDAEFESVTGNMKIDGKALEHISKNLNQTCSAGGRCTCALYFPVKPELLDMLNEDFLNNKSRSVCANLNWIMSIPEADRRVTLQGPQGERRIVVSRA